MIKFVVGDPAPDDSLVPDPKRMMRELPPLPSNWHLRGSGSSGGGNPFSYDEDA